MADVWTFHEKPWRHYQLNGKRRTPKPADLEILSVTQALGILDKSGPLVGWAAKTTVAGLHAMLSDPDGIRICTGCWHATHEDDCHTPDCADGRLIPWALPADPRKLQNDLRNLHLDHTSVMHDAQYRGTATHKVLEDWIDHGTLPNLADFPEAWRGWIRALAAWLAAEQPEFLESELVVGSKTHGFAGKRDTVCRIRDKKRGNALIDAKTSKGIYPSSHFRQLAAYELAGVESGEDPTDSQGILRLAPDGSWEVGWLQDVAPVDSFKRAFLHALTACRDERAIGQAVKARDKRVKSHG